MPQKVKLLIIEGLLYAKYDVKCFVYPLTFHPHSNGLR